MGTIAGTVTRSSTLRASTAHGTGAASIATPGMVPLGEATFRRSSRVALSVFSASRRRSPPGRRPEIHVNDLGSTQAGSLGSRGMHRRHVVDVGR